MSEFLEYDNLVIGNVMPIMTDHLTVASGSALTRGTVVGLITASGKAKEVDSTADDGSQVPYAILAENCDATEDDAVVPVYLTGEFNASKLVFGGTDTVITHKAALRKIGIFLKTTIG